ncbi:MAG: helix-turn-helix domain-containing protein [Methylococcales bacterium]|nr:helix-turn-helix domain-containing protein [Methylococcales bacterium]
MRHKIALAALNLMTTQDVSKEMGCSIRSVQLWVEQGLLEGWKTPGGHRRISRASFERFVASQEMEAIRSVNIDSQYRVGVVEDHEAKRTNDYLYSEVKRLQKEVLRLTKQLHG